MDRKRRTSHERYNYASPNRSPRRRKYSRTNSPPKRRSRSREKKTRYEETRGTKSEYGGPKRLLVLDSDISIKDESNLKQSSPIRSTSAKRRVPVQPRRERKSHSKSEDRNRHDRGERRSHSEDCSRYGRDAKYRYDSVRRTSGRNNTRITERAESYERKFKKYEPNRREMSPYRGHREARKRSHENRNGYDRRESTLSYRRNEEDRIRSSHGYGHDDTPPEESRSPTAEPEDENNEETHEEDALPSDVTPVAFGIIKAPMWPFVPPYRPHRMFPLPRPPHPMGLFPLRPRCFPFPRPPPPSRMYLPPRPLPHLPYWKNGNRSQNSSFLFWSTPQFVRIF